MEKPLQKEKYRILVVDDSPLSIELIFELLKDSGYYMDSADNGQTAFEKLENESFDLVLLDVMMPRLNGYELCRKIKETPKLSSIPVIFITAKNDNTYIIQGFEAGAVDYVTKPFNTKELMMRVKTHIELVRSRKDLEVAIDKAEESSRIKGEFLANMSHEIRTPLYGITGMIDLLKTTELSTQQDEFVEIMQSSASTLLKLINDILDFSKIESGELTFESTPFSFGKNLYQTVNLLKPEADKKGLSLNYQSDEKIPVTLVGDPARINQVLLNLGSNAIKFTNSGGVRINASLSGKDKDYVIVLFEVIDTGIGISEENMDKLFRTFTQVDQSTTRVHGGTGLGLVICKRLTMLMDGKIGVESELGKGSRFWFTCRLKMHEDETELYRLNGSDHNTSQKEIKILLAEDNPVNTKVASLFLSRMGQTADTAENGIVAVDKFKNGNYDLILMDINMPDMDGYEATRIIRQMEAEQGAGKRVNIVAMTANAMSGDKEKCLQMGMDDYISKPFKSADLKRILSNKTIQNGQHKAKIK